MKLKSGPSANGQVLRRTFPTKGKSVNKGKCSGLSKRGAKKEDKSAHKKDSFLVNILEKERIECTEEIEQKINRKCYVLLHGIARVDKEELKWNDEQKNDLFFSRVGLSYLNIETHPSHAENILDSHLIASYSFFKFLIASGGMLTNTGSVTLMKLLLQSDESEMSAVAVHMNTLLHAFSSAYGTTISSTALLGRSASKLAFNQKREAITEELKKISNEIRDRVVEKNEGKDLPSSLADLYYEIDSKRLPIQNKKKVFESSDDEEKDGTTSLVSNGMADGKMEQYERENTSIKKFKVKEECVEMEVDTELDGGPQTEKNRKNKKKKDSKSGNLNHYEEEEQGWNSLPTTSNSMSDEFRSNLVELARESWKKSVALHSIQNEPRSKDRFKMARFIIECLENKYGDELLEILQFFTFQSFDPSLLTEPEEVVGLMLYLDQRKLIADSFFFLLLAMNKTKNMRVALDESEICCRAQLKAAKINRSVLLGKPLQAQLAAANRDALNKRRDLENNKYHILFQGIFEKDSVKRICEMKKDEEREMKKEVLKNTAFTDDFWVTASKLFKVDSEWTTFDVSESAVRVFGEMNKMFKGSLTNIIRTMCGRIPDSAFGDPSSLQSLTSLHRMKKAGFFDGSLLFALLRFNDANAMKKSCSKLSKLCDGFKKVIDAGAKSEGLKTDSRFLSIKHTFSERAMKINAECMKFFNVLMNSKGRKRCLSTSSTAERVEEREESTKEPKKKKRKQKNEDIEEDSVRGKKETKRQKGEDDSEKNAEVINERNEIKEESGREEKKEKNKKRNKIKSDMKEEEEMSEIEDCHIIEVDTKKVKVEVISSDEEGENGEKRRHSKRSLDGDVSEKGSHVSKNESLSDVVKKEIKKEDEDGDRKGSSVDGMSTGIGDLDEEEHDGKKNLNIRFEDLSKVREMLTRTSSNWNESLKKWNVVRIPSMDDRYTTARRIIQFYEDQFGEEFHTTLFDCTGVQFAPSDLQDKDEVVGLVLYMDSLWLSIPYFFFFMLVQNKEAKVYSLLESIRFILQVHLKGVELHHRLKRGESVHKERNKWKRDLQKHRKILIDKLPCLFGDVCKSADSENGVDWVYGVNAKVSKANTAVMNDPFWTKYEKKFNVVSEWSVFDVCERAILVLNQLNNIFQGSLISNWNKFFASNPIDETSISNITRAPLDALVHLDRIKIFPDGLVFLLLRAKNKKVVDAACSSLSALVGEYTKFFQDFGPAFNFSASQSRIKERAYELANHRGSRKCVEDLFNHIKKSNPSVRPIVCGTVSSPSMEGSIPSPNESLWRYNSKWLVTTFWSDVREEWEKRHSSDMDRLSHRIGNFMLFTAMREEHYERKLKVLEWMKIVLKDELEKTESTLDITGSSLCSVGAANSNLDLFFHVAKGRAEKEALVEILKRGQGLELRPSKGPKIHMIITNEHTEGTPMLVSIHLIVSTPYMGRVYQMVDSQDERVAALSLVLKAWRIVEPSCTSAKIQSYHLMNLLIHFLQCGVSPPILPSLNRFYPHLDPLLYRQHELPPPIPYENAQSLASLLIGFFTYYSQFDFEKYIISIREGYLFKRKVSDEVSKKVIMMEPPYENYRLRPQCVTTDVEYCHVRAACRRTLESLTTSFNIPSLPTL